MGNYLIIPNKRGVKMKLASWFNKWKPFYNDFGKENAFEDIFGEFKFPDGDMRFKTGVMDKEFYPKESVEEIKNIITEFGGSTEEE